MEIQLLVKANLKIVKEFLIIWNTLPKKKVID